MAKIYVFENFSNITLLQCGESYCPPLHEWKPDIKSTYLIHFIVSGKGCFFCGDKTYDLCAGNAFVVTPNSGASYRADKYEPWHYMWFEISGELAVSFLKRLSIDFDNPIYTTNNIDIVHIKFESLLTSLRSNNEFTKCGALNSLMGAMIETNTQANLNAPYSPNSYVDVCIKYIHNNYTKRITVSELCELVNVNRSHLFRLFKQTVGQSPTEYIINYKLSKSKDILSLGGSVKDAANIVGYADTNAFSKLFKKAFGISPGKYKKLT
ncbi:MAG: AraC family transcriptional regulator [Eubacteriales bacterium]|nr:AraC family transcriptional regulator [Eubacteriales bacterium]MDY4213847.1 AraC family transcriptional regulator [Eubacteriales bacterium]